MTCTKACLYGPPTYCTMVWSRVVCLVCGADDVVRTALDAVPPDWRGVAEMSSLEAKEII